MISESFLIRPRGKLLRNLVLFARLLRTMGIAASPDQLVGLVSALPLINLRSKNEFRDAARTTLVTGRDQANAFDRAFELFWQAWSTEEQPLLEADEVEQAPPKEQDPAPPAEKEPAPVDASGEDAREAEVQSVPQYSALELLRGKDFAKLSEDELRVVTALVRTIEWEPDLRKMRRKRPAGHGGHLDLRRVLRRGLRYGGEMLELAWQQPRLRPRRLVVLCDVSGSMALYSRVLLQFLYALTNGVDHMEAFAFGTRLTRLTRELRQTNGGEVDGALKRAAALVNDWGGGTRIGESLKTFNYDWARRVLGHGATVAIISDGWDRGDLDLLDRELRRLRLSCRRLMWLNPLLGAPGYQPLAQGIRLALRYVDDFLPVHNLSSLEALARALAHAGKTPALTHARPTVRNPLSRV
jgi:uncharacterized protein